MALICTVCGLFVPMMLWCSAMHFFYVVSWPHLFWLVVGWPKTEYENVIAAHHLAASIILGYLKASNCNHFLKIISRIASTKCSFLISKDFSWSKLALLFQNTKSVPLLINNIWHLWAFWDYGNVMTLLKSSWS